MRIFSIFAEVFLKKSNFYSRGFNNGELAHLARALDWQSKGGGFDPHILHKSDEKKSG